MMKWALLAPALILCAVFLVWPMGEIIWMSLNKVGVMGDTFVGLRNYARIATDTRFLRSMINSAFYILLLTPINVGGVVLIVLSTVDLSKRWQDAVRFVFYIPSMAAGVIVASVWEWVFHWDGPVNWLFGTHIAWFGEAVTAIPVIALITASVGFGGGTIILLAAALSIDPDLYDAARIDGASPRQIKWRITLPIIMPTIWLLTLLSVIAGPQIIEYIIALAPYEHSATMAFSIYTSAFIIGRHGQASAQAMVLLVLLLGLAWAKSKVAK